MHESKHYILCCFTFDPSRSSYYKVVFVRSSRSSPHLYRLEIYSSETQLWSFSSEIPKVNYSRWAYCCGAIYWMSYSRNFLCFDVDKERFQDPSLLQKPKRLEEHETERASEREKEIKEGKTHSPANIKRREII
ncbi:hypothetical protein SCA6_003662 [Theobroma cacao]